MDIARYKFNSNETFEYIADLYSISVGTLASLNNLGDNLPSKPNDLISSGAIPKDDNGNYYVNVPLIGNGGLWETPSYFDAGYNAGNSIAALSASALSSGYGGPVVLTLNGEVFDMPCYPTSLSDSGSIQYQTDTILGTTQPYINYNYSGPRTVSASFSLHREMYGESNATLAGESKVDNIVKALQACTYPADNNGIEAVRCELLVGKQLYISGVIDGQILISYSGPIIDGKYNVCEFSLTITEVYNKSIFFADKRSKGGMMR